MSPFAPCPLQVEGWVAAVIEHSVADTVASSKASQKLQEDRTSKGDAKGSVSFFRGKAKAAKPKAKAGETDGAAAAAPSDVTLSSVSE